MLPEVTMLGNRDQGWEDQVGRRLQELEKIGTVSCRDDLICLTIVGWSSEP